MQLVYFEVVTSSGFDEMVEQFNTMGTRKYIAYLIFKGIVWR